MGKIPYIPLYIGDWEQDTNCISPIAEFALLKLTFKLYKSETRGVFVTNIRTLSILFKSTIEETEAIIDELFANNVLNFDFSDDTKITIISRRMVRESNISEVRSESGSMGGRGIKAKRKQNESKTKAKVKQNTEYEYENDINIIVKLLNEKASRDFSPKAKKTISSIIARLKEGYTLIDFTRVIEAKTFQWVNDSKMSVHLNPETLFGNKFDKYLNESPKPTLFSETSKSMDTDAYHAFVTGQ